MSTVLVTGGSGFVGSHVILQLLNAGHVVRTTVRSLKREESVRAMLKDAGAAPGERLSFFAADLERNDGWTEAVAGCDYVIHVASPMPLAAPVTRTVFPLSSVTSIAFSNHLSCNHVVMFSSGSLITWIT